VQYFKKVTENQILKRFMLTSAQNKSYTANKCHVYRNNTPVLQLHGVMVLYSSVSRTVWYSSV